MSRYRPRDPSCWRMEEQADGAADVYRGSRRQRVAIDLSDAMAYVRRKMEPGETAWVIELDGYRRDVTRQLSR